MGGSKSFAVLFQGLFLAIGIAVGGYFVGQTMYNAKVALNTAEAKGLAERRVMADRANWTVSFQVSGKTRQEIPDLYATSEEHRQMIVRLLEQAGFEDSEIEVGVLDYAYSEFRNEDQVLVDQTHRLRGSISVETEKIDLVSQARASVNRLIAQGIDIQDQPPSYSFTKLNEIKPEMLREATKNARIAANEFAVNAGVNVGRIRSARQGGFIIRDAGAAYGDTAKIEKDVRVVTTISFYLTD
jgi:hypothetical protein